MPTTIPQRTEIRTTATVTAYPMGVEIALPAAIWQVTSDEARVLAGMILDAVREAEQ